jgi:hypothetical protein
LPPPHPHFSLRSACLAGTSLLRATKQLAGDLGTTIKYLRAAPGIGLGKTMKYLRGAEGIGLGLV